ncbi:uncharacterized protein BX663DRAFT_498944 [Cokeromyces recurvatus]|uniref:uncharacterized protein n=1 Tax=Cokeromyces recurvatus TaxID=90255 RepID=UPI00221E98CA|nr:uncharacterized protein BX663DRAFT_498944 [Cokeromyces recurvatus]KAI7906133.1 hypothetical protein BX663DRAFT_498944 [Cokeromyces recurvatus]
MQQEYIKAIEETVSSIDRSSFIEPQNNRYTLAVSDDTKYIESDRLLSMELNRVVTQWQEILKSDPIEDRDGRKTLAYDFKRNEFDIMDLIAQIKGFEARIQFLNRDRAKLNGLPQILPILKSETENYTSDMKAATLQLEKLEKDTIRPSLDALAELKIIWPLQEDHYRKELNILEKLLDDMDKVYKTSVKQRACQQLVSYIYDLNQQGDIDRHKTMEFLVNKLELDIARINEEKEDIKTLTMEDKDKMYLEMIGLFLDDFFRQHDLENDAKELSLIEKIVKLKSYETELKQRWNEDFESCMDAAKELHKLQERLFSSLYSHSSDNHFIMTPRSYTTLQEQLEYKTQELTAELSNLENDINNEEENHVWEQEKKLFSVFFTDPVKFEQLHSNRVNK